MCVGLLVVRLKYSLYVCHLSKWFTLNQSLVFSCLFMVALSSFRFAYNVRLSSKDETSCENSNAKIQYFRIPVGENFHLCRSQRNCFSFS